VGEWEIGGVGDWEIGGVGDWEIGGVYTSSFFLSSFFLSSFFLLPSILDIRYIRYRIRCRTDFYFLME
ncbi:hypothetical protein QT971_18265, partial [Microcoleus sp. herbarium19]